ncbi:hypothetical protein JCM8097_008241 [Rhodosporidiobolus ruineniae]
MSDNQAALAQVASIAGIDLDRARFFLDSAGGDVNDALALYYASAGSNDDAGVELPGQPSAAAGAAQPSVQAPQPAAPTQRGAYTLSGQPVEPLPAGWGSSSSSTRSSTPSNPLRSNTGPRVTGFRDLASSSATPSSGRGGFGGFGGGRGGGGDSDDDEGRDPAQFFAGGAKSGLSVENPDDQRGGGGMRDMIRGILQQAREGSQRLAGEAAAAAQPSFFGGSAHTLGSDEQPSTYIPDPNKPDKDEEEEEELETVTRHLTFWQDGFSIEDGDLLKYDEHKELLAAIQNGRAPLSFLQVKFDQPCELVIADRKTEKYVRQPKKSAPAGSFGGSGQRLGSTSPYPDSASQASSSSMPGGLPSSAAASSTPAGGSSAGGNVVFEVDRNAPTTQVQIRGVQGDRLVGTFNHTHTVGDLRRYIDSSAPSSTPYELVAGFPPKPLMDDSVSLKDANLLGSVVQQRRV